jgi:hypothetical protein
MKKTIKYPSILLLLLGAGFFAQAQVDSTLTKEVEVIKAYQPSISDAYKISSNPRINDTINYIPEFDYRIHSKDIPVDKTINHLPAVKLGTPPRETMNKGYVRAGFGNAWSPVADLYFNTSPTKKTDFGLQLNHFSSRPKILLDNDMKVKSPYSENLARIFIKNTFRKAVLNWELNYQRDGFRYYGFPETDTLLYQQVQTDSLSTLNKTQAFNAAGAKFRLINTHSRAKLDYDLILDYHYFWNATGQTTHEAFYDGRYAKRINNVDYKLATSFEYFNQDSIINRTDSTNNRHQFYHVAIAPTFTIDKEIFQLHAGFNAGTIIGADTMLLWHISPEIYFAYHPIPGIMTLFAGTTGGFNANGYRSAVQHNPYQKEQLELYPREKMIGFYGGFKGKFSRKISYLFDVDYSIYKNQAFYYLSKTISATDTLINNQFDVEYDGLNQLRFGGNLHYSGTGIMVNLSGNYYLNKAKTLTTLPHLPVYDLSLKASFDVTSKLSANIHFSLAGKRNAIYRNYDARNISSVLSTDEIQTLDPLLGLKISAKYAFSEKLGFFTEINNTLNQHTAVWQGYNQPRMLVLAGASYTF